MIIKHASKYIFAAVLLTLLPAYANAKSETSSQGLPIELQGRTPDASPDLFSLFMPGQGGKPDDGLIVGNPTGNPSDAYHTSTDILGKLYGENFQAAIQGGGLAVKSAGADSVIPSSAVGIAINILNLAQAQKTKENETSFANQPEGGRRGPTLAEAHRAAMENALLVVNNYSDMPKGQVLIPKECTKGSTAC